MIEIIWDDAFIRILKKWQRKHPRLKNKFRQQLTQFSNNPHHPSLKTHSLSGQLKNCWAVSITFKYRLVFKFVDDNKVLLIDIGTHDEVY